MRNKQKRHKVEDRSDFDEATRVSIAKKSGECCAWCGKKVYFGYGATIDHFIPLQKGGTNDPKNLVMMCHECNQKKGSRVLPINIAGKYLHEQYQDELGKYFEEYVSNYEYISRGNLLACDAYEVMFLPEAAFSADKRSKKKGNKINMNNTRMSYLLNRAYPNDEDKIVKYYTKYLTKYKLLSSKEAARENIRFWMRFGAIYYIERNGEINAISSVTVNRHGYVSFNLFAYYSTVMSYSLVRGIVTALGDAIMYENALSYLPISVNMVVPDSLTARILDMRKVVMANECIACQVYFDYNYEIPMDRDDPEQFKGCVNRFRDFINRFHDIEDDIQLYLYSNDLMDYSWMAEEILERDYFDPECYQDPDTII